MPVFRATPCLSLLFSGFLAGCAQQQTQPEISAAPDEPPLTQELPESVIYERTLPVLIGVEGETRPPLARIVPEFEPVEPSPREREILGEPAEPEQYEWLSIHQPPRGPKEGVLPFEGGATTGITGVGGATAGQTGWGTRVGTAGEGGRYFGILLLPRHVAASYPGQGAEAGVGPEGGASVGSGMTRTPAARQDRTPP